MEALWRVSSTVQKLELAISGAFSAYFDGFCISAAAELPWPIFMQFIRPKMVCRQARSSWEAVYSGHYLNRLSPVSHPTNALQLSEEIIALPITFAIREPIALRELDWRHGRYATASRASTAAASRGGVVNYNAKAAARKKEEIILRCVEVRVEKRRHSALPLRGAL